MSDTPRTDAATRMAFTCEYMVPIEFAQKIERELAEVTKQRDTLAEDLEKAKIAEMQLENADINLEQCRLNFVGRIKKLEQERDALAEAGNQLLDSLYSQNWRKLPAIRSMRKALAATKGGSHE